MPRGTQFGELVARFREEAGHANNYALGQNVQDPIKTKLRRIYRRLHADFNWPHLVVERDETLQAGERYYSFPSDLSFDRLTDVWVRENGRDLWYDLRYGIGLPSLNAIHSDSGEREDFPCAWELHENEQYEVWPIPETSGHTLRFRGLSRPKALTNDEDTVDLDDDLIVMYAVGEQLARERSSDAELVLQQARSHYMRLRANSQKTGPIDRRVNQDRRPRVGGIDIKYAERRD